MKGYIIKIWKGYLRQKEINTLPHGKRALSWEKTSNKKAAHVFKSKAEAAVMRHRLIWDYGFAGRDVAILQVNTL